jgi:hypothetical protein
MARAHPLLALAPLILPLIAAAPERRWGIVGDVMLSRGVAAELARRPASPFSPWSDLALIGNLEGAPGPAADCQRPGPLCLAIPEGAWAHLAGSPFVALSLENNHADDLGPAGRARAAAQLRQLGIQPLDSSAPTALPSASGLPPLLVVAIDLSRGPPAELERRVLRSLQQVAEARRQSPWVLVYPHWGVEYGPITADQPRLARRWAQAGARLVVGAHPHVLQEGSCADGLALWPSLGNLLFDQPRPETWTGGLLRCIQGPGELSCQLQGLARGPRSALPSPTAPLGATCTLRP